MSLHGDPKPFCDTCHGSREIQISEGVTVTAFHCTMKENLGRRKVSDIRGNKQCYNWNILIFPPFSLRTQATFEYSS